MDNYLKETIIDAGIREIQSVLGYCALPDHYLLRLTPYTVYGEIRMAIWGVRDPWAIQLGEDERE